MKGKLMSFEGIDFSGKSTQAKRVANYLKKKGLKVILVREPGGTKIAEQVRKVLLSSRNHGLSTRAELLLYQAARAQLVDQVIAPALQRGKTVICDRYFDSSLAYQGFGRGLDSQIIEMLNGFASAGIVPNLTILLDISQELASKRAKRERSTPDRLEREKAKFHRRVRAGFLAIAKRNRKRIIVADGSQKPEEIWKKVKQAVDNLFKWPNLKKKK